MECGLLLIVSLLLLKWIHGFKITGGRTEDLLNTWPINQLKQDDESLLQSIQPPTPKNYDYSMHWYTHMDHVYKVPAPTKTKYI